MKIHTIELYFIINKRDWENDNVHSFPNFSYTDYSEAKRNSNIDKDIVLSFMQVYSRIINKDKGV